MDSNRKGYNSKKLKCTDEKKSELMVRKDRAGIENCKIRDILNAKGYTVSTASYLTTMLSGARTNRQSFVIQDETEIIIRAYEKAERRIARNKHEVRDEAPFRIMPRDRMLKYIRKLELKERRQNIGISWSKVTELVNLVGHKEISYWTVRSIAEVCRVTPGMMPIVFTIDYIFKVYEKTLKGLYSKEAIENV